MDVIPKPRQIVGAYVHVAQKVLSGGLAGLRTVLGLLTSRTTDERTTDEPVTPQKPSVTSRIVSSEVLDEEVVAGPAIGLNPRRRYGSSASRSLGT